MQHDAVKQVIELEAANKPLQEYLIQNQDRISDPITLPLNQLTRTVGPEKGMLNYEDKESFDARVEKIVENIRNGFRPSPLLAEYDGDSYLLLDGNHTMSALFKLNYENYDTYVVRSTILHDLVKAKALSANSL